KPERTNSVTLRRIAPLLIGALLLAALLLIHYTGVLDWNWTKTDNRSSLTPVLPVGAESDLTLPIDIYVTVSLEASRFARLARLNDMFMLQYPRIRVHLENDGTGSSGFADKLSIIERGEAPDI